jgi:hypothetical protein
MNHVYCCALSQYPQASHLDPGPLALRHYFPSPHLLSSRSPTNQILFPRLTPLRPLVSVSANDNAIAFRRPQSSIVHSLQPIKFSSPVSRRFAPTFRPITITTLSLSLSLSCLFIPILLLHITSTV